MAWPCTDGLISWFTGQRNSDKDAYISRTGVNDREVLQAGSMKFDGTAYGTFASFPWSNFTDGIKVECEVEATGGDSYMWFTAGEFNVSGFYIQRTAVGYQIVVSYSGAYGILNVLDTDSGVSVGDIYEVSVMAEFISGNQYTFTISVNGYDNSAILPMDDYSGVVYVARYITSGYEFPGKISDLKLYQGSSLIAYIPGVTGEGTTAANVVDPDNQLTIINQPSDFWYSHSDSGGSNYLNSVGFTIADGSTMYTTSAHTTLYAAGAKIPALYGSTGYCCAFDSNGDPVSLQNVGQVKPTLQCYKAPAFVGDGVAYGESTSNLDITGYSAITLDVDLTITTVSSSGGVLFAISHHTAEEIRVEYNSAGTVDFVVDDGTKYSVSYSVVLSSINRLTLVFNGDDIQGYVNSSLVATVTGVTFDFSTAEGLITLLCRAGGLLVRAANIYSAKIYDYTLSASEVSGTPTKNPVWAVSCTEGTPSQTALKTYDRIGSNHITWSSMSATNWQLVERPDWPLLDGFSKRENLIKYSEDLTQSSVWILVNDAVVVDSETVTLAATIGSRTENTTLQNDSSVVGKTFDFNVTISSSNPGTIVLMIVDYTTWLSDSLAITLTPTPTKYSLSRTVASDATGVLFQIRNQSGVEIQDIKVEHSHVTINGGDYIKTTDTLAIGYQPASITSPNQDAAGNSLQYLTGQTMVSDNPTQLKAPLYQPHIAQENDIGVNLWFDGAGGQNALTFGDLMENWNDANFYGDNKYLIYEAAITGDCLIKTEKY